MAYRLGVDMGTTFTAAAVAPTRPDHDQPRMLGLGNRALQIPSALFVQDDGTLLVGEAAERRGAADPTRLVKEFKRRIGDDVPILVAGTPYSPQALTARLLRWVLARATEQSGEAPHTVTLTHPANWGPFKLELLDQVATLADLDDVQRCPEPVAAALQYASRVRVAPGERIAVYDLGGGTFDACVLAKSEHGFEVLGRPEGIEHFGGIDFDKAVFSRVLDGLGVTADDLDTDDPAVMTGLARLRQDCVEAKEALSSDVETVIPVFLPGLPGSTRLTRPELQDIIRPALEDTLAAMDRALRSAGAAPADVTALVLAGGSSRIPLVHEMLSARFGRPVAMDIHPKHDVAMGAARVSGPLVPREPRQPSQRRTAPVTPKRLGLGAAAAAVLVALTIVVAAVVSGGGGTGGATSTDASDTPTSAPRGPDLPRSDPLPANQFVVPRTVGGITDLYVVDATGTGSVVREPTGEANGNRAPLLSPDRRSIVYVRAESPTDSSLRVMAVDGTGDRLLFEAMPPGCRSARPAWDPTDPDVLALICRDAVEGPSLQLVSLDGEVQRELRVGPGRIEAPAFSPDGQRIVYWQSQDFSFGGALYVVDVDGGDPVRITTPENGAVDASPVWSPSGEHILFTRRLDDGTPGGNLETYVMTGDGLDARPLAPDPADDNAPSWSPDGSRIAFWSTRDGTPGVWVMDADGQNPRRLALPGTDEELTSVAWTNR